MPTRGALPERPSDELKNTGYEIFIGMLSILSIVNIVLMYLIQQDHNLPGVLSAMNALLSGIFMIDFLYRITTAHDRKGCFFRQFGWADLLASLPLAQLKFLRIFRLLRVYRLMRALGIRSIMRSLVKDRAGSALLMLLLAGILNCGLRRSLPDHPRGTHRGCPDLGRRCRYLRHVHRLSGEPLPLTGEEGSG